MPPPSPVKTVVTGGAGFIGSYLLRTLLKRGAKAEELLAVDSPELWQSRRCTEDLRAAGIEILDSERLASALRSGELRPQTIFHIGACSNTDEFREDYLKKVNIDYSKMLWKLASDRKIPFFYASSAATYGDGMQGFSDDPAGFPGLKPLNPYGRSKQSFDLWALEEAIVDRTPPRWAGFKFFNVYGPGEDHKGGQASVLFHARKQFQTTGGMKLFRSHREDVKDGEQKRDFVWVGDVVETMLAFAEAPLKSGIYNVGTGEARTFLDLAKAVAGSLGIECRIEFIDTPEKLRPGYQYFTQAELKNLRAAGYTKPFTSLEEGARLYLKEWPIP